MFPNGRFQSMAATLHAIVVVALTYAVCQSPRVSAFFTNCAVQTINTDIIQCIWSSIPAVEFTQASTGEVFLLRDSAVYTLCDSLFISTSNCECAMTIDGNECDSCSFQSLSASSFSLFSYDCSNVLDGECALYFSNQCQSDIADPTPFPVEAPTDFPTDPPEDDPTPFPVEAPTDFPTDPPEDDPTPFPVEAPTDFPTDPPEDNEGDNSAQPPVSAPEENEPTSPVANPPRNNAPVESENLGSSNTSGGHNYGDSHTIGMLLAMSIAISSVFRI